MWTNENRHRYDRSKLRYPDLTDVEWTLIKPLIPRQAGRQQAGDRTRKCSLRPVRANGPGTYAASNDGRFRSGLSRPGPGWASAAQT
jgi:hypothetical protein